MEALASKKKSKVRKEAKPSKSQGRTFIHHQCYSHFLFNFASVTSTTRLFFLACCSILFVCISTAAEDDSDDMFKPPKMDYDDDEDDDDEFSPFGAKSGLFSGGKGLFDDEDEVN